MLLMNALIEIYWIVKVVLGMLSFTLCFSGEDKFKIKCYFFGWLFLGIILKRLMYRGVIGGDENGLVILREEILDCR